MASNSLEITSSKLEGREQFLESLGSNHDLSQDTSSKLDINILFRDPVVNVSELIYVLKRSGNALRYMTFQISCRIQENSDNIYPCAINALVKINTFENGTAQYNFCKKLLLRTL